MPATVQVGNWVLIRAAKDAPYRPALVVRVWNEDCVNALLFVDGSNDASIGGSSTQSVLWITSVVHRDKAAGDRHWIWPDGE